MDDPLAELRNVDNTPGRHRAAMEMLDADRSNPARSEALHRVLYVNGYTPQVREDALNRLAEEDLEGLKTTLRQRIPRLVAWAWLERVCEIIAERGWSDLTPALVSSWARPTIMVLEERERPEYKALVSLHGEARVPDVLYTTLLETRSVAEQGLRTRCWTLLMRLGERQRLVDLLRQADIPADDLFLLDLRAAAVELSVFPSNREEILWARSLRDPSRRVFWNEASTAVAALPAHRRTELELRDLPILVAAHRHEPELLLADNDELYRMVDQYVRSGRRHIASRSFEGSIGHYAQELFEHRRNLTWGDLVAMLMAVRAMQTPEVVAHLFDYADRDLNDKTTEYGGILQLDARGRFEVVEFPPRHREHDQKFNAPNEMFEAGYTALFHFHFHAQRYNNATYAGPGEGDLRYAEATRANCLVMTFISRGVMNVDFFRHGNVMVDLGEINRPESR